MLDLIHPWAMRLSFSATRSRIAVLLVLLLAAGPVCAQDAPPSVTVRGGVHATFDRIVFDWVKQPAYSVAHKGETVTVAFRKAAAFNVKGLLGARLRRAGSFAQTHEGDAAWFAFSVPTGATLTNFTSGQSIVIDIKAPPTAVALNAGQNAKEKLEPPETTVPEAPKTEKAPEKEPEKTQEKPAAVPEAPAAATTPPPKTTIPAPPAPPPPPPATSKPAPEAAATPPAPAEPEPVPPEQATTTAAPEAVPDSEYAVETPNLGSTSNFNLPELRDFITTARFDLGIPVAITLYARAGFATLLLDRKLSTAQEDEVAKQPYGVMQKLNLEKITGYRFPLPAGADVRATLRGTEWQLRAGMERRKLPVTMTLLSQPDYLLGARVLLPAVEPGKPVRFADPVVGDILIAIPLPRGGSQMSQARSYADFDVLATAQGLVIRPHHERVLVRVIPEGVEITAAGGLQLSPRSDTGQTALVPTQGDARGKKTRLFDFATWRGKPGETFIDIKQRLLQTLADVPENERDRVRLEIARTFFSYGMAYESLAQLRLIGQALPDLLVRPEFLALRGAARIMTGDVDRGLADLNQPDLADEPELTLWEAFGLAKKRDYKNALPKFEASLLTLEQYPEPFFSQMATLALEAAIAEDQTKAAYEWIVRWKEQMDPTFDDQPSIQYLAGVIEHSFGHDQKADVLWQRAKAGRDRLYAVRAELALIELAVVQRRTTALEAARRLEGLRYAWRGDELEHDILRRLGSYYLSVSKHREGLMTLALAIKLFPNNSGNAAITAKMVQYFRDLFTGPTAGDLAALDALAVYQEFRNLVPKGEEGKAVIKALAERLVSVDLLDQAGDLLEALMTEEANPVEKATIGTRLAAIRILDRQGDAALSALSKSEAPDLPENVLAERRLLLAKAQAEAGQLSNALQILSNDATESAARLRVDVLWRQQKWADAAGLLGEIIGPPPERATPLSSEKAGLVANRATALALAGDQAGLDQLAVMYGPAMDGTAQADSFRLLTRAKLDNVQDLALLQSKMSEVDLFRKVLDDYRSEDKKADAKP